MIDGWPGSAGPWTARRRWIAMLLLPMALLMALCGVARAPWAGVWPYRIGLVGWLAGLGPCSTIEANQVILHMRPGGCGPFTVRGVVPGDIPLGELAIRLPRYPGAAATDRAPTPVLTYPLDSYLKEASAAFLIPREDPGVVATWYADRVTRLGYLPSGGSTEVEGAGPIGETATSQEFAWPTKFDRQVQVQVQAVNGGGTLLLLEAQIVTPPPRPLASLVPPDAASLTITYGTRGDPNETRQWEIAMGNPSLGRPWRRTVRAGPILTQLIESINAMPTLTGTFNGDLDPRVVTLTFRTRAGRSLVFIKTYSRAGITGPGVALDDNNSALEHDISALAPRR